MQSVKRSRRLPPALILTGIALGSTIAGVSTASRASAAVTPQKKVVASSIKVRPGTLPVGSKVKSSALFGDRVFPNASHGFALANLGDAQYPAATTDGGKTWKTDGPALHLNAAQAPLVVLDIGAIGQKTLFAYGGGNVIDATSDGGKHWYSALFQGLSMAVVRGNHGHLVGFFDQQSSGGSTHGPTFQYVSKDGGRTWRYDTTVGG